MAVLVCRTRSSPPPRHGKACADIRPKSWRCKTKQKKWRSAPRGHGRKKRPGGRINKTTAAYQKVVEMEAHVVNSHDGLHPSKQTFGHMHMPETGEKEHSDPNPGG